MNKWFTTYKCVECKEWLSSKEVMYSNGRCPVCGYKHPTACTVVKCTEHAVRKGKRLSPWWKFWQVKYEWEIKEDPQ